MPSVSAVVSVSGYSDWVYDPQRDAIDIVTTDGTIKSWSISGQAFTFSLKASVPLAHVAITANGAYLLASATDQAAGAAPTAIFERVDLGARSLDEFKVPTAAVQNGGPNFLAITADGNAVFSYHAYQVNADPFHALTVAAPQASAFDVAPLADVAGFAAMRVSDDHRYLLMSGTVFDQNQPLVLYDSLLGRVTATNDVSQTLHLSYADPAVLGDINSEAGLIAYVQRDMVFVFDLSLNLVTTIDTPVSSIGHDGVSVAFGPGGHHLFMWDHETSLVGIYDTQSWSQIGSVSATVPVQGNGDDASFERMTVTAGGHALVLDNGSGLEVIDLSRVNFTLHAAASGSALYGGYGADGLYGGAGADTIDGGAGGPDTLDGGAGADLLSFQGAQAGVALDLAAHTVSTSAQFSNFERYLGSGFADTMTGSLSADTLSGGDGGDSINGGAGDDSIDGGPGANYLRGGDGNDSIQGGSGFDDINGNLGNDTIDGGSGGNDWLVGGQANDVITSHASNDILYGNLGNDTLNGGVGDEIIRGGQGDDVMYGGAGNDWLSGDRGSDTITGGTGADTFHGFSGIGLDMVTDFKASEGDKIQLDAGTAYTLRQSGADTVIDLGNGDEMILKNVTLTTLPAGWIFNL